MSIHVYYKETILGKRIGLSKIQLRIGSYRFNWRF